MSGKPAARQGDMTQYGGSIVQGSAGVRIGAPTGVACSVCPGGVTSGHPVNPLLGAKVLPGETDIALPGPLPFILSRTYSSYRTKTPAPVGSLGPGWKMPADIRLQLRDNTLILSDNGGRSLYFEHLFPGEDGYSRSESLWLVRGGVAKLDEGHRLAALWQALPEELRLSPHRYLATNSPQGPWWLLGWCERVSGLYYNRHRYYDPLQGRYITQDPIGLKGGWNFYQYPLNPVQYIDSMGLASKYGHLNNGGYGARPNKPPTPDPSKLPDIAKQLRLPYPIDQASSAPNVFKTFFRALSPYDYTLYCRKWVKPNLTCTPQDDSQYPGMDTKTASDYLPQTNWPTTQLPPGYTCAEPYLFPDINKPDGPATAGIDDLGEILAKMKQRTSRGIRK
ncbi:RHS repeat protein [Escherichia coli]|nr:RHS repeat protein [Escherichia coli]